MTTSTTCQNGIPITGRHCGEHCHGWCLLDGEPCAPTCRNPLDEPVPVSRGDVALGAALGAMFPLLAWLASLIAY